MGGQRILAIETATEACSAALYVDGEVSERFQLAPREHALLILPMIDALLVDAGMSLGALDAVAYGRGPGSFTGVRIAASVAQGVAFAADLPVVAVSTLASLALGAMSATGQHSVMSALDARMNEVYWGLYEREPAGLPRLQGEECVCAPGHVRAPESGASVKLSITVTTSRRGLINTVIWSSPEQNFTALETRLSSACLIENRSKRA